MRRYVVVLTVLLIVLFTIAPVIVTGLASLTANFAGCDLNEGEAHVCVIHGKDYGEALYKMGMFEWMIIFTAPIGALALAILTISTLCRVLFKIIARNKAARRKHVSP